MYRTFRTFLFILSLVAGSNTQVGQSATTEGNWDLSRQFHSAQGKTLTIDLRSGGDVRINGVTGDEVSVRMRREGRDSEDIEMNASETSSGIEVTSNYDGPRRSYNGGADVEVDVPARYNVELETTGGDVTIHGVEGEFTGKTMGGELTLTGLKGKVDLSTMGGEIAVSDSDLDGEVETMGGDVTFRNVSGSVHGSTMGGDVRHVGTPAGGSRKSSSRSGEQRIHSMGGDLDVDSAPDGASLETMGGDIHIGDAADHVQAQTMGGDIQVDSIDGWADLTTMGGDVTMRMTGDPARGKRDVEITSMGGDIELTLPEGIAASFDLETEYSRHSGREPRIISDFPVQVTESTCEEEHGKPCTNLRGTGTSGAGTHHIKIRTIQGDITIRKG